MSELDNALKLFDFLNINDITNDSLKKAFKKKVLQVHPDKGGNSNEFDTILAAFIYITDTYNRINGGRTILQNIESPDKLKELRPNEIINSIFEEFHNDKFNKDFETLNTNTSHGYNEWLKTSDNLNIIKSNYGDFPVLLPVQITPSFNNTDFHKIFEDTVKKDKPEANTIILHPEEMAYVSGTNIGTNIIENHNGDYTSDIFMNPQYTDIYSAFTNINTITDKISGIKDNKKTFEDVINERNTHIKPFDNNELKTIQEFEKNKIIEQNKHFEKVKHFFENNSKQNIEIENILSHNYNKSYLDFVIDI
jgi:curved DNA-binding protein CbpA